MNKNNSTVKTTHTPGPWTMVRFGDNFRVEQFDTDEKEGLLVAHVNIGEGQSYEQGEADARLIAAAPELLAGARALLAIIEANDLAPTPADDCFDAYESTRAAILRAEGK